MSKSNSPTRLQTDAQLVRRFVRERDEAAFEILVRRHRRLVWSVCQRVLSDRNDCEDAFQMTFALLARKAAGINKPAAVSSWLHSVALKTAVRIRRQRQQLRKVSSLPGELIGPSVEPFEEIAHKHQIEQLDQQLQSLGEKYRTPLVLFYYLNQTTSQIAHELSLSISAVEGRLKRGRQQLKCGLLRQGIAFTIPISLATGAPAPEVVASTTSSAMSHAHGSSQLFNSSFAGGISTMLKFGTTIAATMLLTVGAWMHRGNAAQVENPQLQTIADQTEGAATEVTTVAMAAATEAGPLCCAAGCCASIHDHLLSLHDVAYSWFVGS